MSRSADRALALGLVVACAIPPTAAADPSTPPGGMQPNVVELRANVFDLYANASDLSRTAEVTSGPRTIDVRLNSNVLFAKDSAVLQPAARKRIAEVGAQLRKAGQGTLQVVGYTDDLGSSSHGLTLSRQRAEAVRKELAPYLSGITTTVKGLGEADPLVPNTSEANRSRNRRVELHFTKG